MQTKFRALRSGATWGIVIGISGHILEGTFSPEYRVISDPSGMLRVGVLEKLTTAEIEWIEKGLRYFLATHPGDIQKPLQFRIDEITFNYCDFQEEGMAPAINQFLAELLGLKAAEISITYDKPSNRYTVHLD